MKSARLVCPLVALSLLACGTDPTIPSEIDAAPAPPPKRDARPLAPDPSPPVAASPDAAAPLPPDAGLAPDASAPGPDGGPVADSGPAQPVVEATWPLAGCNFGMLMYPNIDKNMGKFPPGSCPPPDNLPRPCGGDSKIPVMMATASAFETGFVHPPEYSIDQYMMTRWSTPSSNDHFLALDLGAEKSFQRIYLAWEAAYGSGYDIETSPDGQAWTAIKQVRGGNGFQDIVDVEGRSRYLRIKGVTRGSMYGYSLFDVTICGQRP